MNCSSPVLSLCLLVTWPSSFSLRMFDPLDLFSLFANDDLKENLIFTHFNEEFGDEDMNLIKLVHNLLWVLGYARKLKGRR